MEQVNINNLPYRNNISCIVFKKNKFLLVQLNDWQKKWWKFPQGGMNENETEEAAAKRELREELGSDKFRIITKSIYTNQYDWPDEIIKAVKYRWRGQLQSFFLVEFYGKETEIIIDKNEINKYRWVELSDLMPLIDHKEKIFLNYRIIIEKILNEFKLI